MLVSIARWLASPARDQGVPCRERVRRSANAERSPQTIEIVTWLSACCESGLDECVVERVANLGDLLGKELVCRFTRESRLVRTPLQLPLPESHGKCDRSDRDRGNANHDLRKVGKH